MFSLMSVCPLGGASHVTTTHDTIDQPEVTLEPIPSPNPLTHHTGIFLDMLESGWLAFDWKAFLLSVFLQNKVQNVYFYLSFQ